MAADTWLEALRDPHVPIHWLVALQQSPDAGQLSGPYRYADADLHISGKRWIGALEVTAPPGLEVDPYTGRSSTPNLVASISPVPDDNISATPLYPYDIEATYRRSLLSLMAKCWRWAEGTPFSEAQLLVDGYVYGVSIQEDGTLKLDIADKVLRFNRQLPRWHVSDVRFANPYGDDKDSGYPILYGAFVRVPCPVVDTTADKALVADTEIDDVSNVWIDDVDKGTPTTEGVETDLKGASYYYVTEAGIGDKQLTASGNGYLDDADGYYTGTANALIEHPADQLHHLARTIVSIPEEFMARGSFGALRNELAGWVGAAQILAYERTDFAAVRQDSMAIMRSACFAELGLFRARHFKLTRGYVMHLKYGEGIHEVQGFDWGDKLSLYTSLQIRFAYKWIVKKKTMDYSESYTVDTSDYYGFQRNRDILRGISNADIDRRLVIETRAIQAKALAVKVADLLKVLHGTPRKKLTLVCDRSTHSLRMFDAVRVTLPHAPSTDGTGMTGDRYIVVGFRYGLTTNTLTLLEALEV